MATPVIGENDANLESHADKEAVTSPVKPKRYHLKEVPPAHKKIGHLKVDKDGEMLYKKTPSSTLMQSLQLGIQQAVGSLEPKPKRDLLMTDFEVVESTDFPSGGGEFTLAHRHKDFRFKDYSPVAFRFFREAFQIKPEDYMVSICHYPMKELSNPGASGSLFYRSADDEFIMKTVSKKEAEFLQKLLPGYYLNLTQNKRTLLPKFFGLYNYQSGGKNIRITVMNNLLPSTIEYHEKYDLKGSSYKRYASPEESAKAHPTYKDVDFLRRHPEGIALPADVYDQLISTVKRDVMVLKSFGIMDYSLLVGIHNIDEELRRHQRDQSSPTATTLPLLSRHQPPTLESPLQRSLTVRRMFSIIPEMIHVQTPNLAVDESNSIPYEVPPGGILGKTDKGDRVLLFIGIIDILQSYRFRKKLEHTFKSVITDGDTVSVHKPGFYMKRFSDYISTKLFKKEVKTKPKTRRSITSRPAGTKRQASVGSEDVTNNRSQLPRQRSLTTEIDLTKRHSSPPLISGPPPGYSENPTRTKSPEHLLRPRLSSVEELHDDEHDHTPIRTSGVTSMADEHDHASATIATTQEDISTTTETASPSDVATVTTTNTSAEVTVTIATTTDMPNDQVKENGTSHESVTMTTPQLQEEAGTPKSNTVTIEVTAPPEDTTTIDPVDVQVQLTATNS